MGATSAVAHGLSGEELQTIRDAVTAGRKPKVMFTEAAGQIAGQVGQVVELTDPAQSDEWVVVRFGRDELPFAPTDLRIAPRKAARRSDHRTTTAPSAEDRKEPRPSDPATPESPAESRKEPRRPDTAPASPATAQPGLRIVRDSPSRTKETSMTTVDATAGDTAAKPARRSGKAARSKGTAGLTVTLAYQDGQWTVSATQGNKSVAKPHEIKPAEALKIVALVDSPDVQDVVEQILAAERTEAEQQAEKLRAELAKVEARLAELQEVD